MDHPEEEWQCPLCGFTVWRYIIVKEKQVERIEFIHSKIHPDGSDPRCIGHLVRTGRLRGKHIDEVRGPGRAASLHPRTHFNDSYWTPVRPEEVPIGEEI